MKVDKKSNSANNCDFPLQTIETKTQTIEVENFNPYDESKGNHGWACYLIVACEKKYLNRRTYVGMTNNLPTRLRRHNGEICGGAKYTKTGRPWRFLVTVHGFRTQREVLQFEWAWKRVSAYAKTPIERRLKALDILITKERWTKNSPLSKDVPLVVRYHFTTEEIEKYKSFL